MDTSHADTFLMSDIIFCHICPPKIVVFVVKVSTGSALLRAHVLECLTQQAANTLYTNYYKASNQYKLNRYRNSKRRCEFKKQLSCLRLERDVAGILTEQSADKQQQDSVSSLRDNNVNVIEVRSSKDSDDSEAYNLVQHTDSDGITHIEIESGPVSLSPFYNITAPPHLFGSSCPNSLITERDSISEREKKQRQREPALLLRDQGFNNKHGRASLELARSRRERFIVDTTQPPRGRDPSRPRDKHKHSKGPAPIPPPRRHPNDSSLLLVPTKSGHEPKKSYYPKESHIVRGNKIVRVDFPSVPIWHADPNNNARHYLHYTGGWAHEYHAPRIREPIVRSEVRRRSRSKSPARKPPIANRYLDAVSTFNFSQKLREFSDAVFSSSKRNSNNIVNTLPPASAQNRPAMSNDSLRSVIRKTATKNHTDSRRVTFSAYATVQLLD